MSNQIQLPRGTQDVLPDAWRRRALVQDVARRAFDLAGFGRISTPTFEHTELFHRGVGETSDIVGKETYTFEDRGGRSLTLRPEGTAGVSRAFVSNGMHRLPMPVKLWYCAAMFRYEKPQAGRVREHEQIGCEVLGSESALVDAEVIALQAAIYRELGLPDLQLQLNSVGSVEARSAYRAALVEYLQPFAGELDQDSRDRLGANPLRILDSKVPRTREIVADAPALADCWTDEDRAHLELVQELLAETDVAYVIDPLLVRGLDYYSRTVWEFSSSALGAQSAVGAGGRYDGLVQQLGGPATPAVGFGTGIERIVMCLEAMGAELEPARMDVFVGSDGAPARAFALAQQLRARGLIVELDLVGRSPKAQAKQAARLGAAVRVLATADGASAWPRGEHEPVELPEHVPSAAEAIVAMRGAPVATRS